jgi:hypothetical protein
LLLSRALSSRLLVLIVTDAFAGSSTLSLQQVVDRQVLSHQAEATRQGLRGLFGSQALESAVADAVVLPEIAVHGLEAVVRLAGDDVRLLAFGVTLPANNPLMCEPRSDIVQGGTLRR